MKILILYTPRSGTNSLAKYFLNQNPDYIYFNQPWSHYKEGNIRFTPYEECIKHENVLIKSVIENFNELKIDKDKLYTDFDKVLMMSRDNKKEQSISLIVANQTSNFLNSDSRKYFTKNIDETMIDNSIKYLSKCELLFDDYRNTNSFHLKYEDLFYNRKFDEVFNFLKLSFVSNDFENILDIKNKYFNGEYELKTNKTLF